MIWTSQPSPYAAFYTTSAPIKGQDDLAMYAPPPLPQNTKHEPSSESRSRRRQSSSKNINDEEKRKNFLERNRQAALKCRQRKKQWLNNLQAKIEYMTHDNEQLQVQVNVLQDEVLHLRTLLMAHKDCHPNKQALKEISQPAPLIPVNPDVGMIPTFMPTDEGRLEPPHSQDKIAPMMPNSMMYY